MGVVRLAILGAGSLRCSPPVLATLSTYFGERPLAIHLWDADAERLDLFDRFARVLFRTGHVDHELRATEDAAEALEDADLAIVQVGPNCARRVLGRRRNFLDDPAPEAEVHALVAEAVGKALATCPGETDVLSLLSREVPLPRPSYYRLDWPPMPSEGRRRELPHLILRILGGEDYPQDLMVEMADSPLRAWLNDPRSAEVVLGAR